MKYYAVKPLATQETPEMRAIDVRFAELMDTMHDQKKVIPVLKSEGVSFDAACDAAIRYARKQPHFAARYREARKEWNNEE